MNSNIIELIISKLPESLKREFESDYTRNMLWSPEWEKWAEDVVFELDQLRDKGEITKEDWNTLYQTYFYSRIGGKLGTGMIEKDMSGYFEFIKHSYDEINSADETVEK